MAKKFTYADINLGDVVTTKARTTGTVVALSTVTMINHEATARTKEGFAKIQSYGVQVDEVQKQGRWYWTIQILVTPDDDTPYIESTNFDEIVKVEKTVDGEPTVSAKWLDVAISVGMFGIGWLVAGFAWNYIYPLFQ